MNQSVAPTSFITSTSRRRENSDRRIVLAMSSTEATISRIASTAIVIFTRRVTVRILLVSPWELLTVWIAESLTARWPGGVLWLSSVRTRFELLGLSGVTRSVSGSGL